MKLHACRCANIDLVFFFLLEAMKMLFVYSVTKHGCFYKSFLLAYTRVHVIILYSIKLLSCIHIRRLLQYSLLMFTLYISHCTITNILQTFEIVIHVKNLLITSAYGVILLLYTVTEVLQYTKTCTIGEKSII